MKHEADHTWMDGWSGRIRERVAESGADSLCVFLSRFPAEPYVSVAARIGANIAAIQLECVQFEEAEAIGTLREAAIDSLARDLVFNQPLGWEGGAKGNFGTSGARIDWQRRLDGSSRNCRVDAVLQWRAKRVWAALERLGPPIGWLPAGPDDPWLVAAFSAGWDD